MSEDSISDKEYAHMAQCQERPDWEEGQGNQSKRQDTEN